MLKLGDKTIKKICLGDTAFEAVQPVKGWIQPIFCVTDSRNSGTASSAFDGDTSTFYQPHNKVGSWNNASDWLQVRTGNGLNVTRIDITNRVVSDLPQAVTKGYVQVSGDGSSWTNVGDWTNDNKTIGATWSFNLSYEGYYKYLRIYFTNGSSDNAYTNIGVSEIHITATEQTEA